MTSYSISWTRIIIGNEGTMSVGLSETQENIVKHGYDSNLDRCWMEMENGSIREIPYWRSCDTFISADARKKLRSDAAANIFHSLNIEVIREDEE